MMNESNSRIVISVSTSHTDGVMVSVLAIVPNVRGFKQG
jgi:hypothetical protein